MTWSLANVSCALGAALVVLYLPGLLAPATCRKLVRAFPRHEIAGWLLTAIALIWIAVTILHASLGRFEAYKPAIYVLAPVAFVLIVVFLDDLLAARSLGGVLLLLANPILAIARWHESQLRLVVTVVAYLMVMAGILLVLSPYRFRQATAPWIEDETRCRIGGALGVLLGGMLVALGSTVY